MWTVDQGSVEILSQPFNQLVEGQRKYFGEVLLRESET
jgi:hypothetical protein